MAALVWQIALAHMLVLSCATSENVEYRIGKTRVIGTVVNYNNRRLHLFQGVPFARPPVGNLRFKAPVAARMKDFDVINATRQFPDCIQLKGPDRYGNSAPISEDCLYLKIWVPETPRRALRPVLVMIYGGGFSSGSVQDLRHDGKALATELGYVVVGVSHRVGAFGFMDFNTDDVPGNMAFMDQQLGLKWVHRYIRSFGGDPNHVTVIGESAGGVAIAAHIINSESRRLIRSAIMDSGTLPGPYATVEQSKQLGFAMAAELGCSADNTANVTKCLLQQPAEDILAAQRKVANPLIQFKPTVGSRFLPGTFDDLVANTRGRLPRMLVGFSKNEGSLFVAWANVTDELTAAQTIQTMTTYYDAKPVGDISFYVKALAQGVEDYVSDGLFKCPAIEFAHRLVNNGAEVYFYQMNYHGNISVYGGNPNKTAHTTGFIFAAGLPLFMPDQNPTQRDIVVTKGMMSLVKQLDRRDIRPRFGQRPLARFLPRMPRINVINEDGSLTYWRQSDREQVCRKTWQCC